MMMKIRPSAPAVPLGIYLTLFFLLPVAFILGISFSDADGTVSLAQYEKLFSNTVYVRVLWSTLVISMWVAVASTVIAYPISYVIASARPSVRQIMMLMVLLPFWTSFLIRTFAWIVLLGRKGVFNTYLQSTGLTSEPLPLLYNFLGVMTGMMHAMLPIAVLTILPVMMSVDTTLTRAAALLGAGPGQRFWRIYFPLTFPGVAAAWLLVFVSCLGFFITPALLGSAEETMVTQLIIVQVQQMLNWRFAGALSFLLLVAAGIVFFLYDRTVGIRFLTQGGATGATHGPQKGIARLVSGVGWKLCGFLGRLTDLVIAAFPGKGRSNSPSDAWLNGLTLVLLGSFLVLPTVFLIPVSFSKSSFIGWPPEGWTLDWYREFFTSSAWTTATVRSLIVAGCSAAVALLLGVPAAFALSSPHMPHRTAWLLVILSPFFIPRIVIAIALFYLFAQLKLLDSSIGLILGHTVLGVPYVVITVMAVLNSYDFRLNHAAWTLGASRAQALRHVTFPIIKAGLFSAFLFAFVTSFDDVTLALFLSAGTQTTLPKLMWADATMQVSPLLAAVSTIVMTAVMGLIVTSEWLRARTRLLTEGAAVSSPMRN